MRFKAGFLAGFSAGYVLGAKAGRERYDQIVAKAQQVKEHPGVQRVADEVGKTVDLAKGRAAEVANRTVSKAGDNLAEQAGKAKEFVANVGRKDGGATAGPEPEMTTAGTVPSTSGPASKLP